jgi:hypothetical protein
MKIKEMMNENRMFLLVFRHTFDFLFFEIDDYT